jgi:flagellar assembly protein FliH
LPERGASRAILKQQGGWTAGAGEFLLAPRPSKHDAAHADRLLNGALRRAEEIVAEARAQAAALLAAAEQQRALDAEALRAYAVTQAREQLWAEGEARADATFERFRELVYAASVIEQELRRAHDTEVRILALATAGRIIDRELLDDPEAVARVASIALAQTTPSAVTQVYVHPDDLPIMQRWAGEALGELRGRVELVADSQVGRGGCVIGTRSGFVDARIATQLGEVNAALAEGE